VSLRARPLFLTSAGRLKRPRQPRAYTRTATPGGAAREATLIPLPSVAERCRTLVGLTLDFDLLKFEFCQPNVVVFTNRASLRGTRLGLSVLRMTMFS